MKYFHTIAVVFMLWPIFLSAQTATKPGTGDGTSGSPYQISSLNNLYWIVVSGTVDGKTLTDRMAAYYIQTASIDAAATSSWGGGWTPIGGDNTEHINFTGSYDGQGFAIDNLYCNQSVLSGNGFFGHTIGGVIKNLAITRINLTSSAKTGGLIGWQEGTAVSNCYTTGVVNTSNTSSSVGGLVGYISSGSIILSYSSCSVSGGSYIGGLIGQTPTGTQPVTISKCFATGSVLSYNSYAGGLMGLSGAAISDCYARGAVSCSPPPFVVGGLVGNKSGGTIANCYSTGVVPGSGSYIGRLTGYGTSSTNSFYSSTTSGTTTGSSSGTAETDTWLKTLSNLTGAGWSASTWSQNNSINEGFPYLIDCLPLPVELTSFTAETAENSVQLNWKTATEVNNFGFDVEKNVNGSWSKIGFVEGHGTTNAPKSYSYADANVSGNISYRLKQIDRDGKFEYSKTVEVTAARAPKEFALEQNYPNPFNPTTAIGYQLAASGVTTLKIYDAIGREVATLINEVKEAGTYSAQFDGVRLSSGIYFAKLTSDNKTQIRKLLLMK